MDLAKSLDPDPDAMNLDPKHCFPAVRSHGFEIFLQGGSSSAAWIRIILGSRVQIRNKA